MRNELSAPASAAKVVHCLNSSLVDRAAAQRHAVPAAQRPAPWPNNHNEVTPEQILKAFNTRAFKREQPDKPELMLEFVAQAQARRAPIPLVMYWGKGLRPALAAPEYDCLNYLNSMMARIADVYEPGALLTLVFTDTHASLNGHSRTSIHTYFQSLECAASERNVNICLLSSLVNAPGLLPVDMPEPQMPPEHVLAELCNSAAKWFKGQGSTEEGAIRYFQANMIERKVMERAFPRSIFVTFNGSQLNSLFPETLPIFYMFSLRRGLSDKPWFLPPDFTGRKLQPGEQPIEHVSAA